MNIKTKTKTQARKEEILSLLEVMGVPVKGKMSLKKLEELLVEAKADPAKRSLLFSKPSGRDPSQLKPNVRVFMDGQPLQALSKETVHKYLQELKVNNPKKYEIKKWEILAKYGVSLED